MEDGFRQGRTDLWGARSYLTLLWRAKSAGMRKEFGKSLIITYLKLLKGGLFAVAESEPDLESEAGPSALSESIPARKRRQAT